jgi:hypothetical protein
MIWKTLWWWRWPGGKAKVESEVLAVDGDEVEESA